MPRPVPSPFRHAIVQRFQAGERAFDIAATLGLPERTVRDLWARWTQSGESALKPDYNPCGRRRSCEHDRLREDVLKLRGQHPHWGAGRLRVELKRMDPQAALPSERTLQRWLSASGEPPAPAGRPSRFEYVRATSPHEVWQVDAGEQKTLASGQKVSWLRFVDECSGAVLKTFVFSPRTLQPSSSSRRSAAFSPGFAAWGLPDQLRMDNGSPWGSPGDLPTPFGLWLCGLAIKLVWNPARQPQYNGVVERSNRLVTDWAEPKTCQSVRELQRRVDQEDVIQREEYPALEGRTRREAFPTLMTPRRPYTLSWEKRDWDFELVKEFLSHYVVPRRVDGSGKIGLHGGKLYVGTRHKRTDVLLHFDPTRVEWVVSDRQNHHLTRARRGNQQTQYHELRLKPIVPIPPLGETLCHHFGRTFCHHFRRNFMSGNRASPWSVEKF